MPPRWQKVPKSAAVLVKREAWRKAVAIYRDNPTEENEREKEWAREAYAYADDKHRARYGFPRI